MHTCHYSPEEEADKEFVCFEANAITCPWTMMIHSHDAVLADAAMVCSWRLKVFTFLAPSPSHEAFVGFFQSNHVFAYLWRLISIFVGK